MKGILTARLDEIIVEFAVFKSSAGQQLINIDSKVLQVGIDNSVFPEVVLVKMVFISRDLLDYFVRRRNYNGSVRVLLGDVCK